MLTSYIREDNLLIRDKIAGPINVSIIQRFHCNCDREGREDLRSVWKRSEIKESDTVDSGSSQWGLHPTLRVHLNLYT